jgi:hypothetical protein
VCLAIAAVMIAATALSAGPRAIRGMRELVGGAAHPGEPFMVAQAMPAMGVSAGQRVAIVYPPPESASVARLVNWARPARVTIVAEVPPEASNAFWRADADTRARVFEQFRSLGIRAVVTMHIPPTAAAPAVASWHRIEGTPFAVLPLTGQ